MRFAREGLPVAVVARTGARVLAVAEAVSSFGVRAVPLIADSTDEAALRAALDAAADELGAADVVVYNAAHIRADRPGELSVAAHRDAWAVNVVGAITAAAHVLPGMARRGNGSFIVTGGMPEPKPQYTSLSLGKAGVRSLVALLDQEYGPRGVQVATVTVAGDVVSGTAFDPDDIAEHYWRLHTQPHRRSERAIVHDEHTSAAGTSADRAYGIITDLLSRWRAALRAHRIDELSALFTPDAQFQGITRNPLVGPSAIRAYYEQVAKGTTATVEILTVNPLREDIVAGFADVAFTAPTGETSPMRLSVVAERIAGTWSISQYHAAERIGATPPTGPSSGR
jgi:uncharacterized protein (TIGR02246 family)